MRGAILKNLIKYGIGIGLLAWVLLDNWNAKPGLTASALPVAAVTGGGCAYFTGVPGLGEVLQKPISVWPLLLGVVIAGLSLLITFLRWHILVRAQGLAFTRHDAIRLGLIGYYFNTFLPGSVGGDVVKAVGIARQESRRTVAVATVLIDRAVGLWALVWFVALIGGFFWVLGNPVVLENLHLQRIVQMALFIAIGTGTVWVLMGFLPQRRADGFAQRLERIPRAGGALAEFWRAVWLYRHKPGPFMGAMLLSLIGHTGWVLTFHFSFQVFDVQSSGDDLGSLSQHFLIVPVGMVIQALIPSPGGVGGGEAAFGWLYSLLGKPEINGIMGCLAYRLNSWVLALLGAIIFTQWKRRMRGVAVPEEVKEPVEEKPGTPSG